MQRKLNNVVLGAVVQISLTIKNMQSVLADPSALRLKLRDPDDQITTYVFGANVELVKDAVGTYHADVVMSKAGKWAYRWESDAPNAGADEGLILVSKSIVD